MLESDRVKVDCSDQQGRTALELAVSGNDVDIVCYLLERSSPRMIHKALLCAADNDVERYVLLFSLFIHARMCSPPVKSSAFNSSIW